MRRLVFNPEQFVQRYLGVPHDALRELWGPRAKGLFDRMVSEDAFKVGPIAEKDALRLVQLCAPPTLDALTASVVARCVQRCMFRPPGPSRDLMVENTLKRMSTDKDWWWTQADRGVRDDVLGNTLKEHLRTKCKVSLRKLFASLLRHAFEMLVCVRCVDAWRSKQQQ